MNVLDLFSGIGGFSLGLQRAGFRTVAFAEIDEWCQRVLAKHWPEVLQLGDVTTIGVEPMSSSADSPAKTSARPGEAPALPAAVPLSGGGYAEPFAWYDRNTQSWRTWQRCLIEEWTRFVETWPRSGMTRNGIAYQLPTLAPLTYGTGFGSSDTHSIPTPTASDHIERENTTGALNPAMWPTPTSRDYKDGSAVSCANVPTNVLLGRVVHQRPFPTPMARDATNRSGQAKRYLEQGKVNLQDRNAADGIHGSLNPTWVEWLMGYPLGWTVLKDWGTRSSRRSRKSSAGQS